MFGISSSSSLASPSAAPHIASTSAASAARAMSAPAFQQLRIGGGQGQDALERPAPATAWPAAPGVAGRSADGDAVGHGSLPSHAAVGGRDDEGDEQDAGGRSRCARRERARERGDGRGHAGAATAVSMTDCSAATCSTTPRSISSGKWHAVA